MRLTRRIKLKACDCISVYVHVTRKDGISIHVKASFFTWLLSLSYLLDGQRQCFSTSRIEGVKAGEEEEEEDASNEEKKRKRDTE